MGKTKGGGDWVEADNWQVDYAKGAGYEIYSIPLEVLSEHSSFWTMSFARQVTAYQVSSDLNPVTTVSLCWEFNSNDRFYVVGHVVCYC